MVPVPGRDSVSATDDDCVDELLVVAHAANPSAESTREIRFMGGKLQRPRDSGDAKPALRSYLFGPTSRMNAMISRTVLSLLVVGWATTALGQSPTVKAFTGATI